jgi:hypothetical protein
MRKTFGFMAGLLASIALVTACEKDRADGTRSDGTNPPSGRTGQSAVPPGSPATRSGTPGSMGGGTSSPTKDPSAGTSSSTTRDSMGGATGSTRDTAGSTRDSTTRDSVGGATGYGRDSAGSAKDQTGSANYGQTAAGQGITDRPGSERGVGGSADAGRRDPGSR